MPTTETAADPAALHGQFAADYDQLTQAYHCYAAEVLFGLVYEYTRPGQCLLDLGIGTGLSAAPFAQAGLAVWGVDVSADMLAVCRAKNLAVDLRVADLAAPPWPYAPQSFEQVVACGLLHFFGDLDGIFQSVARVLRPGGYFTFTTKAGPLGGPPIARTEAQGLAVYTHSRAYVAGLAARHGLTVRKDMRFIVGAEHAGPEDVFLACVVQQAAPPA